MSRNEITGDRLINKTLTKEGESNWDKIFGKKVESPCIGVCTLINDVCKGCKRTTEEITEWYNYTNSQKQVVIDRIKGLK